MKTAIITISLFFYLFLGNLFAQGHNHSSDEFSAEFTGLIQNYMVLKDALVESDANAAISAASQMQSQLEEIGEHRLEGDNHMKWMNSYNQIDSQLSAISAAGNIDEIRVQFYDLSETLAGNVKSFEIDGVVYIQHCPMAFNNEGGSWLSNEDQVANPYMPDTMLRCGRVLEKIES